MRAREEIRLEDRFENHLRRHLRHTIAHRGNAQGPPLAVGLGNVLPSNRRRSVLACLEIGLEVRKELPHAHLIDVGERLFVDARRTAVCPHPLPRRPQDVTPVDTVIQGMEAAFRRPLGCGPQTSLEVACFDIIRWDDGGIGPALTPGHALTRGSFFAVIKVGTLRSSDVLLRRSQHYYGPLGLPLRSGRLHARLIRRALP